jgi:hypothetical protein
MGDDEIEILDRDLRTARKGLREGGVPTKLLDVIGTRALRSQRRQTGLFKSNRAARWKLDPADPQYGTEVDCKLINLRLLGMMLEFRNAPVVDDETRQTLERYLGQPIRPDAYRDALTLERLDYAELRLEVENPTHGQSRFHIGHENPKATPKHTPTNVSWREGRSNSIQGDLTLPEARTKFVELIARYFELGEVHIESDE